MNEQMRKEFEAYIDLLGLSLNRDGDNYSHPLAKSYWLLWKFSWESSRRSLVVNLPYSVCRTHVFELPHSHEVGMEHDEYFEIEDIKNSLKSSGVSYK